jgi:DNA-binding NtrC family response regulator
VRGDLLEGSSRSPAIRGVLKLIGKYARLLRSVVFTGPTGAGKGFFARWLHKESGRGGDFVEMSSGQLTESLLQDELFGHEPYAFTGAQRKRKGAFQRAAGGVLFLDEAQHWSPLVQHALLHVLGEAMFQPVGADREVPTACRTLFASTRPLDDLVLEGSLLPDLRWRMGLFEIPVPPLSARRVDILPLAAGFREQARLEFGVQRGMTFDPEVIVMLLTHDWPGNLRELRGVVEHGVIHADAEGSSRIEPTHLPSNVPRTERRLGECAREIRQAAVEWMLGKTGGNQSEAARRLGLHRNTVVRRVAGNGHLQAPTTEPMDLAAPPVRQSPPKSQESHESHESHGRETLRLPRNGAET